VLIAASPYCQNRLMNAYPVNVGSRDAGPPEVLNAAAPLQPGDRITAMNGRAVPGGKQGYAFLNREGGNLTRSGQPLQLTALRGRQRIEATYNVVPACAYNINLEDNNEWNAYADGETMHVERKLMDDLANDDDLAFVVAHELAHNLLSHVGKSQQNMMAGALIGLGLEAAIGAMGGGGMSGEIARAGAGVAQMRYSQEFEREADYVGLYILANSGYDLNAGPRVARRIAEQDARAIHYAGSHPSSADRAASLMATIREIEEKVKRGAPLAPNAAPKRG
jgi:beta-barrel assembly-enhancing protease